MADPITPKQLALLQLIAKHPGVERAQLEARNAAPDLAYLIGHELVREREADRFRATHLGEMVLKRGL